MDWIALPESCAGKRKNGKKLRRNRLSAGSGLPMLVCLDARTRFPPQRTKPRPPEPGGAGGKNFLVNRALVTVFGLALLLSAALLFSVQPLIGKLLLPLLGGAPAVWNTVMVFFQAMLLAGYAYAHFGPRWLGARWHPAAHVLLLAAGAGTLPFTLGGGEPSALQTEHPALWVLWTLFRAVGLPVFVLASTAPLLQSWFARTGHAAAKDPYFLYAASNLGSFGALFAYPFLIEPFLRLQAQTRAWTTGFWIMTGFIAICAWLSRQGASAQANQEASPPSEPVPGRTILKWVGLAFVPSSLMLGVTNYVTTDVSSVPLLWVLPLGMYLGTFVIAFSRHAAKAEEYSRRSIPILALAVVFPMLVQATEPVFVLVLLHLLFFLFAALRCHLQLAASRPSADQLTQFYLYLSLGGVLGGIFNALLAPVIFKSIIEYPLMIVVAIILGFPLRAAPKPKFFAKPVSGGLLVLLCMAGCAAVINLAGQRSILAGNLLAGLCLIVCFLLVRTPVRYALSLGALLFCTGLFRHAQTGVSERDRNFFGVLRVASDRDKPLRRLFHGTTIHGVQFTDPAKRCQPLSYYHSEGPVGEITRLFQQLPLPREVGLVGLGAGAMLSFSQPGEHWTIYEIDPAVIRIAQDTNHFTYLSDCARAPFTIHLGDARLRLREAPAGGLGLLYVDAFSSDVIPMHLLTVEAFRLFREKLAPGGILALHLSSRHFELEPLVANLGQSLGLQCFESARGELNAQATLEGGLESTWVILAPESALPAVGAQASWRRVAPGPRAPFWTDDFSSLLGVFR